MNVKKRLPAGTPKARCEVRLPCELDVRLDKLAARSGVTRTAIVIAAMERFLGDEDAAMDIDALLERLAALTVGQDALRGELRELRSYLENMVEVAE